MNVERKERCVFDVEIETNEHFIKECVGYAKIWDGNVPERNKEGINLKTMLNTKDEEKRKLITNAMAKAWKKRRDEIKDQEKKEDLNKALVVWEPPKRGRKRRKTDKKNGEKEVTGTKRIKIKRHKNRKAKGIPVETQARQKQEGNKHISLRHVKLNNIDEKSKKMKKKEDKKKDNKTKKKANELRISTDGRASESFGG